MPSVEIRTGSRLHFGLFPSPHNPNGFGGVGMMINSPGWRIVASPSQLATDEIVAPNADVHARIAAILKTIRGRHEFPSIRIEVKESIPAHVGLGSGTQLAMATAEAILELIGYRPASWQELAELTGRAKRSCVGAAGYWNGGVIVDEGGAEPNFAARCYIYTWLPAICMRPDVIVGIHADAEDTAFENMPSFDAETAKAFQELASNTIPDAVWERDREAFYAAVQSLNRGVGKAFSAVQGGVYSHPKVSALVEAMTRNGAKGVIQSSWGPTVVGFVDDLDSTRVVARKVVEDLPGTIEVPHPSTASTGRKFECENVPELLVSVRSVDEVRALPLHFVDVLDFKDPAAGPLGRPDPKLVAGILDVDAVHVRRITDRFSLALGELEDYDRTDHPYRPYAASLDWAYPRLMKIGFANLAKRNWLNRYSRLVELIRDDRPDEVEESWWNPPTLVPVAYADHENARAPGWRDIFEKIAVEWDYFRDSNDNYRRILVDTFDKSKRIFDYMPDAELRELLTMCRKHGVKLALAGSLRAADIEPMAERCGMLPDVVAVRGAACKDGNRDGPIDPERVVELHRAIRRALWKLPAD